MSPILKSPHEYSRRILLVVIGMTPQIVTETLYKLAVKTEPAFIPTELHIITTQEGANSAKLALLGLNKDGWFYQLCQDYNLLEIRFDESCMHIIQDTESGRFINDNQSTEQNRIAADFITHKIYQFTQLENSALHVSLAGGRKTMSFYAGYALSLYGRMQDRLSHVLVSDPFQSLKEFFYPRPVPERLEINNKYFNTADAQVILADIPFVRMRYLFAEVQLLDNIGYQETVGKIQRLIQPPSIRLFVSKNRIELNGCLIDLADADFSVYLWLCQRRKNQQPPLILDMDGDFVESYLSVYVGIVGKHSGMYEKVEDIAEKIPVKQKKWFQQRKSKLHKKIIEELGSRAAQVFLIQSVNYEEQEAYQIEVDAEAIEIINH